MAIKIKLDIDVEQRLSEMEHFVCCHDITKTYCGLTISEARQEWVEEVECPACMALSHMFEKDYCYCPGEGKCSHSMRTCSCPDDD